MQKIFNTILVLVFLILVALFVYKSVSTPEVSKVSMNDASVENTKDSNNNYTEEDIQKIVKDYIISNPQILVQAIENMQKKNFEESSKQSSDYLKENLSAIEESDTPPVLGNKSGDLKLVMFFDYNCSYCKKAHIYNQEIIKKDPDLKLILRPLPILGEASMYAAKVALAIHKISEEKFPLIHDGLMKIQPLNEENIKALLKDHDIDYSIVENEINSYAVKELVSKNFEMAKNLGVKGAPSYVINGYFVPGLIDGEKFDLIIKQLRTQAPETTSEAKSDNKTEDKKPEVEQTDKK